MNKPKVSVVVTTYNEEEKIANCLASIDRQDYSNFEIILVDSKKTTDQTKKIAKRFTNFVYSFGYERSPQRNYGAKVAKGSYIIFIDADMELSKSVLTECVDMASKGFHAVIVPEKSFGESYWARCKALERNCYIGDELIEAARFFKKSLFLKVGGFDEKMISGEDWDLTLKFRNQGWKVGRIFSFIYHNEGKLSLIKNLRKKFYYSKHSDEYISKNVNSLRDIFLFLFRPSYFKNWKFLLSDPIHFPGFLLMKTLEFAVGGFGAIIFKRNFWRKMRSLH